MAAAILPIVIGIVIIILGIINYKGNITTLHSYHRSRVKPQDVLPFGRLVGVGTIIIGISIIIMGVLTLCSLILEKDIYTIIGTVFLIIGLVVGISITFYAMIKYNKGIF
ncbi:MAG: hypothetical protein IKT42_04470 [Clostridia bacterium]|nr:hypothetical protein [Clostridia bacterium]